MKIDTSILFGDNPVSRKKFNSTRFPPTANDAPHAKKTIFSQSAVVPCMEAEKKLRGNQINQISEANSKVEKIVGFGVLQTHCEENSNVRVKLLFFHI